MSEITNISHTANLTAHLASMLYDIVKRFRHNGNRTHLSVVGLQLGIEPNPTASQTAMQFHYTTKDITLFLEKVLHSLHLSPQREVCFTYTKGQFWNGENRTHNRNFIRIASHHLIHSRSRAQVTALAMLLFSFRYYIPSRGMRVWG